MKLQIGIAKGQGTSDELTGVFERVVSTLTALWTSIVPEYRYNDRKYHSHGSLLAQQRANGLENGDASAKDASHYQAFCEDESRQGTRVLFRTAINAQALYLVRERLQSVKVEIFEDVKRGGSLLLVRDQVQGFYSSNGEVSQGGMGSSCANTPHLYTDSSSSSSSLSSSSSTIYRTCRFQKATFESIITFALERSKKEWGESATEITLVYKFHLFDNLFEVWAAEWREMFQIDLSLVQPDTFNKDLVALGLQGKRQLVIAGNEFADIMEPALLDWFREEHLRTQESSFAENIYLAPHVLGLTEFQTCHGSADDLAGQGLVDPTATIRAAVAIVEGWAGCTGISKQADDVLKQLWKVKIGTPNVGGNLSTQEFASVFLGYLCAARSGSSRSISPEELNGKPGSATPDITGVQINTLASTRPVSQRRTAAIVIDFQNDLVSSSASSSLSSSIDAVVGRMREFVQIVREQGLDLIFTRYSSDEENSSLAGRFRNQDPGRTPIYREGTKGFDIHVSVSPQQHERVFDKRGKLDPFLVPEFVSHLHELGIQHLFLAGLHGDTAVNRTARSAFQRGIYLTIVKDATLNRYVKSTESTEKLASNLYGARLVTVDELATMSKAERCSFSNLKDPGMFWRSEIGGRMFPSTRKLFDDWSGLSGEKLDAHLHEIRDKAWKIAPWPCVGEWMFLLPFMEHMTQFHELIHKLNRPESQGLILDLGACFGQDLRRLAIQGVSSSRMRAVDLDDRLWNLGFEMFQDQSKFNAVFLQADMLVGVEEEARHYGLPTDPQTLTLKGFKPSASGETYVAPADSNGALQPLQGRCSAIINNQFVHLFSLPQQTVLCIRMTRLSHPGTVILGFSQARLTPSASKFPWGVMFFQNKETWNEMWRVVQEVTNTKWRIEASELPLETWGQPTEDVERLCEDQVGLEFYCERLE